MHYRFTLVFFFALSTSIFSQFDFSPWNGTKNLFLSNDINWVLNADDAGKSLLYKEVTVSDTALFYLRFSYEFSPSLNNSLVFVFCSDSIELKKATTAFYAKIGESGNEDGMDFYLKRNGVDSMLFSLGKSFLSESYNSLNLLVRKINNNYELQLDVKNQGRFHAQLSLNSLINKKGFLSLEASYTKSNVSSIIYNEFSVKNEGVDIVCPWIESFDLKDVSGVLDFALNRPLMDADSLFVKSRDQQWKLLKSTTVEFSVELESLFDILQQNQEFEFKIVDVFRRECLFVLRTNYVVWQFGDVVFNEVMLNPDGNTGSKELGQYLEFYNNKADKVSLGGLQVVIDGKDTVHIVSGSVPSQEYMLLKQFPDSSATCVFSNWVPLSKTKGILKLMAGKVLVDEFSYDLNALPDSYKKEGGWSLELGFADDYCFDFSLWDYSNDFTGGTPGLANSTRKAFRAIFKPTSLCVTSISFISNLEIEVSFSSSPVVFSKKDVVVDGLLVESVDQIGRAVYRVVFSKAMKESILYDLKLNPLLTDCRGNNFYQKGLSVFGIPQKVGKGDLVINEVLFNPNVGVTAYLEFYNKSDKLLDLSSFVLGGYNSDGVLSKTYVCTNSKVVMEPDSYVCLAENIEAVRVNYESYDSSLFVKCEKFPHLSVSKGKVALLSLSGVVLDELAYSDDWHSSLLADTKGVSLERIDVNESTQDANNWASADFSVGYGTPGFANSVKPGVEGGVNGFLLSSDLLSAENPIVELRYNLKKSGFLCDVSLFTCEGVFLNYLYSSVLLNEKGVLFLDISSEQFRNVRSGIYVLKITGIHDVEDSLVSVKNVSVLK